MCGWLWLAPVAWAGPVVGLVAEPEDVAEQYRAQARAAGRSAAASELVCQPAFDSIHFCLTLHPEGAVRWRYGTKADLTDWADAMTALGVAEATGRNVDILSRMQTKKVEGTSHEYWASSEDDGLDAAPLLQPGRLMKLVGGPPVVAVPAQGVVIAWLPGHPERDQILAVGVRRMHDAAEHPISPRIYRWDGKRWVVWGEVTAGQ